MADANAADDLALRWNKPVYVSHTEALAPYGGVVGRKMDFVRLRAYVGNVYAFPEADAEVTALADGIVVDAAVFADGFSVQKEIPRRGRDAAIQAA